jgi:hypothetical protein
MRGILVFILWIAAIWAPLAFSIIRLSTEKEFQWDYAAVSTLALQAASYIALSVLYKDAK